LNKPPLLLLWLLLPFSTIFPQIDTVSYLRYQLSGKDFSELKQMQDFSRLDLDAYEMTLVPYGGKLRVKSYVKNDTLHFNSFDGMTVRYGFLTDSLWRLTRVEGLNKKTVFDAPQKLENDEKTGVFYGFVKGNPVPIIEIIGDKVYFNDLPIPVQEEETDTSIQRMPSFQNNETNVVFVYPNPAKSELHISRYESQQYAIYDLNGKMVKQSSDFSPKNTARIDVSDLPSGTYFLKIENKTYKFIKQ
jgi:hypothetical protein